MRLPWWFWLAYADVKFWYVSVPAAVALALIAWFGAAWLGGARWVLAAAVVLLALPFPAAAFVVIYQTFDATRFWRNLDVAETIAGLPMPAGSRVHFADKAHSIPMSIELPHVTEISGMRLTGLLQPLRKWREHGTVWGGILAEDQWLDGLPCRAGPYAFDRSGGIIFDDAGVVYRCTLAAEHDLFGLKLPRGTTVTRGDDGKPWDFLLPADAGAYVPALATTAPAGVTLSVANDGRLTRIGSGHGQTIVVRSVPLNTKSFELRGEVVVSELAQPFAVSGEVRPAGSAVRVNLETGVVSATIE